MAKLVWTPRALEDLKYVKDEILSRPVEPESRRNPHSEYFQLQGGLDAAIKWYEGHDDHPCLIIKEGYEQLALPIDVQSALTRAYFLFLAGPHTNYRPGPHGRNILLLAHTSRRPYRRVPNVPEQLWDLAAQRESAPSKRR